MIDRQRFEQIKKRESEFGKVEEPSTQNQVKTTGTGESGKVEEEKK